MKKKKSLIVEHDFLGENSFVFGVFGSRRGLQANHGTVRKSAISAQPGNRKRIKWSNTTYWIKEAYVQDKILCISSNKDLILLEGESNF